MNWRLLTSVFLSLSSCYSYGQPPDVPIKPSSNKETLYRWMRNPTEEIQQLENSKDRLQRAVKNPEYLLDNWIDLPTAPQSTPGKTFHLSLREAILLALRYNPNIQNAELDRIVQRYQLRLAHNEFELRYALAGSAVIDKTHYSNVGDAVTKSYIATPEFDLKTKLGSTLSLKMDNTVAPIGDYNPLLNFSFTQPLLRGLSKSVNEAGLLDAIDNEWLNKVNLQQSVIDQVTQVITAYRALVLSGKTLQNQRIQLKEARELYNINEKKIAAGQLEPTGNVQPSYQIESLNLMVEQAENDFTTASLELLQTIGLDPDMKIAVPSDVTLDAIQIPTVGKSIDRALTHNAAYLALKMLLRADERAYKVAKDQQLWQLDFNANVQAGTLTDIDNQGVKGLRGIYNGRNITESAGVTLVVPLNDKARRNQLISAKVRLEKDRLNLIAAKRTLITVIKNTIHSIQSQAKRYALAKKQVALAAQSYALEKKKQQAGIASALDVNNTQNQWIASQIGLINAKIAYLNQLSALQRILGTTLEDWHLTLRYSG